MKADELNFEELDNFVENCVDDGANPLPNDCIQDILDFVDEVNNCKDDNNGVVFVGVLTGNTNIDSNYKKVLDDLNIEYNEDEMVAFSKDSTDE